MQTGFFPIFSNDGTEFAGTVFQKVNKQLDLGVQLSWTAGSNVTRFGIGARYAPDADTTFRVIFFVVDIIN